MFVQHASEIRTKSYVLNYTKFWTFFTTKQNKTNKQTKKKNGVLKSLLTKDWHHFGRRFCSWNNGLMFVFQCFKNYGSPTRVACLKVAWNIADPFRIKNSDSCLKQYAIRYIVQWMHLEKEKWKFFSCHLCFFDR